MTKPGPYITTAVRYPATMLVLILIMLLPVAWFGVLNFKLSDPDGGQLVRDSIEAEQAHAFQTAAVEATTATGSARTLEALGSLEVSSFATKPVSI